jgi:hypothetical protein
MHISATALARLACKSVLVMLGFLCLVIFFDFNALGGPGFHPWPSALSPFPPPEPSKSSSFFHHFWDAFLDRFLIDLGSVFPPNLLPKTHQNQ